MPALPVVDPARLTAAQKEIYDRIAAGARGRVGTMFLALLHSPGLAGSVEGVGEYLRYRSSLSERVRELAISTVAAYWKADVEWTSHAPRAAKAGVPEAELAELAAGKVPSFADASDRMVYNYVRQALAGKGISDPEFNAVLMAFGEEGLLDLTGIAGYYTMLAVVLNALEVRPPNADIPWRR